MLPDVVREDYLASYEGERFVESMRYVRTYPTELPVLRDLLPEIQTPVQIIAGARDPAVPPVNAEYLHERLPKSKLDIIDAGHFTWEDAADEYAALVTSWWREATPRSDSRGNPQREYTCLRSMFTGQRPRRPSSSSPHSSTSDRAVPSSLATARTSTSRCSPWPLGRRRHGGLRRHLGTPPLRLVRSHPRGHEDHRFQCVGR